MKQLGCSLALALASLCGTSALVCAEDPGSWVKVAEWKADFPPEDPVWAKLYPPCLAISPQGDLVALSAPGGRDVEVHEIRTGKRTVILKGHVAAKGAVAGDYAGAIGRLCFSADGQWVFGMQAFSPRDPSSNWFDKLGCINLWKVDGSEHRMVPIGSDAKDPQYGLLQDLAASPKGTAFAVLSVDSVLVGDLKDPSHSHNLMLGALVGSPSGDMGYFPVRAVFSPDGSKLVVGFNRPARDPDSHQFTPRPARLAVWDLNREAAIPKLTSSPFVGTRLFSRIDELAFSPDGDQVLVTGDGAWIWNLAGSKTTALEIPTPYEATFAAGFSGDGSRVVLAGLGTQPFRGAKTGKWPDPLPDPVQKAKQEARLVTFELSSRKATTLAMRPGLRAASWNSAKGFMAWTNRKGAVSIESPSGTPSKP
ncbi:MAG TPA: WD40 repeat domain-containing protein [Isosphaeraceae bacterium]|jgi:WD40 repeat protein|nr:WD40 repeat domain-containing protein [Isosphaeraceae bacterium]